jgi:predicted RNA-binding Zn-ribbon protein involved in translation (DUF1610 family)
MSILISALDNLLEEPEAMSEHQALLLWDTLPIEARVEDVCPQCGLHMIGRVASRIAWLQRGGVATCSGCGTTKQRSC